MSSSLASKDDLVVALAELYLDTDVRSELPRLAEQIVSSGVSDSELQTLWRSQVTPCVHWNLKSSAGEWAGFDRRWLLAEVNKRAGKTGIEAWPWLGGLVHRIRAFGAEAEFQSAHCLAKRLAQVPARDRSRRVAIWLSLSRVYYSADSSANARTQSRSRGAEPQSAQSFARLLVGQHRLEPFELVEEFRAICDLLAELVPGHTQKHAAESVVAAWLEQLGLEPA